MINTKVSTFSQVLLAAVLVSTALNAKSANAAILTTFEQSTTQTSTLYNQFGNNDDNGSVAVYTQTFNGGNTSTTVGNQNFNSGSLTTGSVTNNYQWTNNGALIGTYDNIYVRSADAYGGAIDPTSNGTRSNYPTVNPGLGGLTQSTLTFAENQKYFGMWWSAGDTQNRLAFYDENNNLVGNFDSSLLTKTILQLPTADQAAYKGNPTLASRPNTGEYYAYVNFFATESDSIRKVVFSNAIATGFESDNHAVATTYNSIRGVGVPSSSAVPEPLTILGAFTAIAFGVTFKRHSLKASAK